MKKEIARNLFIARVCNNINHVKLVEKSGLTRPIISGIENGSGNPTLDTVLKLANTLNLSLEALFLSERKFLELQSLLNSKFKEEKINGFEIYIPKKQWNQLLIVSNENNKKNSKKIIKLCNQVLKLNFNKADEVELLHMVYYSTLGILFQNDGFLRGFEFGAWLGSKLR